MRLQPNPVGNERLTAVIGVLLLVPVVVELATIVLGVHTFMSLHVFNYPTSTQREFGAVGL